MFGIVEYETFTLLQLMIFFNSCPSGKQESEITSFIISYLQKNSPCVIVKAVPELWYFEIFAVDKLTVWRPAGKWLKLKQVCGNIFKTLKHFPTTQLLF